MKKSTIVSYFLILSTSIGAISLSGQNITDAAFVKIDPKLGKVIYHRVLNTQTLYSIARGYGVTEEAIIQVNPGFKGKKAKPLPPLLIIPITSDQVFSRLPLFRNKSEYLPVYYQVQKKDNLYRICRTFFDMPINVLVNRNNIIDEKLTEGQTVHIGWLKKDFTPLIVYTGKVYEGSSDELNPGNALESVYEKRFLESLEGANLIDKNEVAFWKSDEKAKGLFIMHRYAAQSSIIEITNPMYGIRIYAKVIGNIPTHLYPREVDMVISKDAAAALKAVDAKFFVRSRYMSAASVSSR